MICNSLSQIFRYAIVIYSLQHILNHVLSHVVRSRSEVMFEGHADGDTWNTLALRTLISCKQIDLLSKIIEVDYYLVLWQKGIYRLFWNYYYLELVLSLCYSQVLRFNIEFIIQLQTYCHSHYRLFLIPPHFETYPS